MRSEQALHRLDLRRITQYNGPRQPKSIPVVLADAQADVVSAESERVVQRVADRLIAGFVGDESRFTIQSAAARHESDNYFFGFGFGFEYFMADNISFVTQFDGTYVQQIGSDASGANVVTLLRWHFVAEDTWSAYIEAGAGLLWMTNDVPSTGSDFNFTPQAALGLTFDIGSRNRGFIALGWHHISNANTFNDKGCPWPR